MSETEVQTPSEDTKDIYSHEISQSEYEALRAGEQIEPAKSEDEKPLEDEEKEKAQDKEEKDVADEGDDDSEIEENSEDEDDSEDDESDEDDDEDEDEKPNKKRKTGWQKRRERYNRRLSEKDEAISARERRIQELESELKEKAANSKSDDSNDKPVRPSEDSFETYEAYRDAYDEYVENLTDWKAEQIKVKAEKETAKNSIQQRYEKAVAEHTARVQELKKAAPDFEEVFMDGFDGVVINPAFEAAILESDISAELVYAIAKNPDDVDRINALPPHRIEREIGRYEARILSKKPESTESKTKVVKKTKAPKPLGKTVGTKGNATAKDIYDAANISQAEYERRRAEQLKR